MSEFSKLDSQNNTDHINIEAASWIAQLDAGSLSASDKLALAEWISRSPRHAQEIRQLASLWGDIDYLIDEAVLGKNNSSLTGVIGAWFSSRPKHFALTLVYSSIFITVLFSIMVSMLNTGIAQQDVVVYDVKKGNSFIKTLSDGSVIHLNTDTVVEIQYSQQARIVRILRGEVFFDVAKDPSRPFEVFVGNSQIVAVGTAFDIRLDEDKVDVIVTEGKIRFNQIDNKGVIDKGTFSTPPSVIHTVLVEAGHKVKNTDVRNITPTDPLMIERQTAWRKGELVFVNSTLAEVVSELSRYNVVDITMEPELRDLRIGGRFLTSDVDRILEALELSMNIHVQRHKDGAISLSAR